MHLAKIPHAITSGSNKNMVATLTLKLQNVATTNEIYVQWAELRIYHSCRDVEPFQCQSLSVYLSVPFPSHLSLGRWWAGRLLKKNPWHKSNDLKVPRNLYRETVCYTFVLLGTVPSIVHDGGSVIWKRKGLAILHSEVFLHPWKTCDTFPECKQPITPQKFW